jgi:hypothetical protein
VLQQAAAAIVLLVTRAWGRPSEPPPTARLELDAPNLGGFQLTAGPALALSRDGSELVYVADEPDGSRLYRRPLAATDAPIRGSDGASSPFFSPDGRQVGFFEDFPRRGPGRRRLISNGGGAEPEWSSDGRELYYRRGDEMHAVDMTTDPPGASRLLFAVPRIHNVFGNANYDVAPDGRFLVVLPGESRDTIDVVVNWSTELERLAPSPC